MNMVVIWRVTCIMLLDGRSVADTEYVAARVLVPAQSAVLSISD